MQKKIKSKLLHPQEGKTKEKIFQGQIRNNKEQLINILKVGPN